MRKAKGFKEVSRNENKHRFKHTSIGSGKNVRVRNKHKKRQKKEMSRAQKAWEEAQRKQLVCIFKMNFKFKECLLFFPTFFKTSLKMVLDVWIV